MTYGDSIGSIPKERQRHIAKFYRMGIYGKEPKIGVWVGDGAGNLIIFHRYKTVPATSQSLKTAFVFPYEFMKGYKHDYPI